MFCTLHPESVDALFSEALRLNMRILAGKVMMDRHAPEYLTETAEQSYRQTPRADPALAPPRAPGLRHYPALCPHLDAGAAVGHSATAGGVFPDTWLHTHLSENLSEVAWVKSLWPEHEHYLDVYHHYRLTGERSVFAHGIHLADAEWRCLHETGSALGLLPDLEPVPRQRPVSPARQLAAAGADRHRHRRRGGNHLQHAAHAGGSL
ncbi:Guanine deaminase [Raoultella terrigena]|uniref:Guanine deaminase n=1 Tax=Raoultella terrigena TaxID=577 RepID=A0A4U9DGJ2_RAOTE|nr:Guanine deaminase [Raoultella terrigena]